MTRHMRGAVGPLCLTIFVASCSSAPPPGPLGSARDSGAREPQARAEAPRPALPLPAALPLTTFAANGERIDPIVSLQDLIESGEITFSFDPLTGYLPSLLAALDIPVSSQGLVFSRTSLQTDRITPWTPRAIYFNDDVYVGFVQDSPILEIASINPDQGAVFYLLPQSEDVEPTFQHETTTCLMCHESRTVTGGIPGVMMRSVLTDRYGYVVTPLQEGAVTDRTPLEERLGGWYVTGTLAGSSHAGNVHAPELTHEIYDKARYLHDFDMNSASDVTSLEDEFDTSQYLTGHSDIVALLVLGHQTRVHNLITLAHEAVRTALRDQDALVRTTGQAIPESGLIPSAEIRIQGAVDRLVREMLFAREAPLGGQVEGTSGFAEEFSARGPRDSHGRSFRDFDLEHRLFKYPLSFLIYTEAFDALPELVRRSVYNQLDVILSGDAPSGVFDHLTTQDRLAIREILVATKPDFETLRQ